MLEHLVFTGRDLLVVVILAVLLATVVYLLETLLFSRRRKPALEQRLAAMQVELDALKARLEQLELRPPLNSALDTQASIYAEAMRLAREGLPAQEVAEHLGISRSEAELIIALQRSDS